MRNGIDRRRLLAGTGAFAGAALLGVPGAAQTQAVRIGTSSIGTVFHALAVGIGEMLRDEAGINATVESVGGSAANVNGIGAGIVDMAVANSFSAEAGFRGEYGFPPQPKVRLALQGSASRRHLFIRNAAGIRGPEDLHGRTIVAERRALPELRLWMDAVIAHYGLDADAINIVATTETNEAMDAMRAGSVDGVVLPFAVRAALVEEAMRAGLMSLMPMEAADRDALLDLLPSAFYADLIPGDEYSGMDGDLPVVSLNTYLIASSDVDDDIMHTVAKVVLENTETFASYHAQGRQWTLESALTSPAAPYHDGVIRYFEEVGAWTPEMAEVQARFFA